MSKRNLKAMAASDEAITAVFTEVTAGLTLVDALKECDEYGQVDAWIIERMFEVNPWLYAATGMPRPA